MKIIIQDYNIINACKTALSHESPQAPQKGDATHSSKQKYDFGYFDWLADYLVMKYILRLVDTVL